tara:strand:- start:6972 stop:8744 length:1773 start_codon:yes stop_codon:yes gene_type:complete
MAAKGFGIKQLDIIGSTGTPLVESKTSLNIRVAGQGPGGIGHTVGIGTTGLATWLSTKNNADPDNVTTLNCGIVTANYLYGTFRGIIDPGTSTISLNSNIQDVLNVASNEISADDAGADKIVFWDDDTSKLTHLAVGTGLQISGTTLSATADAGKTYTLDAVDSGDNAILRLSDGSTNDDVTITAGSNITINPVASTGFTIAAVQGAGLALDTTVTDVLDLTSGTLSADDAGADKIVFWDDDPGKLTHLTVGTGLQISGTTLSATSAAGKTYTLEGVDSGANAILRLSDGTTDDDVTITAGTGIAIDPVAADGFTISATSAAGKTYTLEAVDSGANAILRLSDGSVNDDVTITAGANITIDPVASGGFTIAATASGTLTDIQVDQTGYTCTDPITVSTPSAGIKQIDIANSSNGYGRKFVQDSEPSSPCNGDIWYDTSTGGAGGVTVTNKADATYYNITFITNSSSSALLVNDDDRLQVRPSDGALRVAGDITAFYSSDRRLKDNISPIKNALDKVSSISGNTFKWNEKSENQGEEVGVIAQEIEALGLPGITTTRNDGTKAVRYEKLIPLLIEAIKELKVEVDELKDNK